MLIWALITLGAIALMAAWAVIHRSRRHRHQKSRITAGPRAGRGMVLRGELVVETAGEQGAPSQATSWDEGLVVRDASRQLICIRTPLGHPDSALRPRPIVESRVQNTYYHQYQQQGHHQNLWIWAGCYPGDGYGRYEIIGCGYFDFNGTFIRCDLPESADEAVSATRTRFVDFNNNPIPGYDGWAPHPPEGGEWNGASGFEPALPDLLAVSEAATVNLFPWPQVCDLGPSRLPSQTSSPYGGGSGAPEADGTQDNRGFAGAG